MLIKISRCLSNISNQTTLLVISDKTHSYDSTEDLDIVPYLTNFHEIIESSKKIQKSLIDLLKSKQFSQYA